MGISAVVLTKNSERHLAACLESLRWVDEVVALDDASDDATRAILEAYGCRVYDQPTDLIRRHRGNFDVARNRGFELAREAWILVVDSDEIVTEPLRDEILGAVARGAPRAYALPRRNRILGRFSRLLGEDFQLRLFPKGGARYRGTLLDARPEVSCPVEHLSAPLLHLQSDSWRTLLRKLDEKTSQRARALHATGETRAEAAWPLFVHTFRFYHREQGARAEGLRGALLAALYAAYPAITQAKLRRLQRGGAPR